MGKLKSKSYTWNDLWLDSNANKQDRKINYAIHLLDEIESLISSQPTTERQLEVLYFEINDFAKNEENLNLIQLNTKLFTRIVISGMEFMNLKHIYEDFLYLGAMIDMKIKRVWNKKEFYETVSGMIKKIKYHKNFITDKLKQKIASEYKESAGDDFYIYFG